MAASTPNKPRPNRRTYYLHRDGSVSKRPTPSHQLRIRAASQTEAAVKAMAAETMLRVSGLYFPFAEV